MIVVMTLVMILSAFVGPPLYNQLSAHGLTAGIRDVSNHLVKARSEAIAKHTLTRFMVAKAWTEKEGDFSKFSIWRWNQSIGKFERSSDWATLPPGIVFEPGLPHYIRQSNYAINDATTIIGEDAMAKIEATEEVMAYPNQPVTAQFVEFLPNGSARIPEGVLKKVIFVLVEGDFEDTSRSGIPTAKITIKVDRDKHPKDTQWTLKSPSGEVVAIGRTKDALIDNRTIIVEEGGQYTFQIYDGAGNGMSKPEDEGETAGYAIGVNETNVYTSPSYPNFGNSETQSFQVHLKPPETRARRDSEQLKLQRRSEDTAGPDNWAQVNLDTLTGRVRIYRP